ncbi:Mitochondrial Rho GTPase [Aphelenchoides bicaudatus]|nr:Mitochondrial Rho GTPase [Aphelenchoides bicaudatus]
MHVDMVPHSDYDDDYQEFNEEDIDVKILVVGDEGSGKTSIIFTLLEDCFVEKVPPNIETVVIPPETSPDQVVTAILDYSSRVHDNKTLNNMIKNASVIVVVFSVDKEQNLDRISSHWMPLIFDACGPDEIKPVLLVANKSDNLSKSDYISKMVPLMNNFGNIETVVECSALAKKNVSEIFYYAQRAVIYPMAPLYDITRRELTAKFKKALLSDIDNDGLLSDCELRLFQMRAFGMPLTDDALEEVKNVVLSYETSGVIDSGITLRGFFYLHEAFMQRGRQETAWTGLKAFGYDSSLQLAQNYLYPNINIPFGSSTELSSLGFEFLRKLFRKFDEDRDGRLSPTELKNLMSVCPGNSWPSDFLHSTCLDENGWLSERAFLNLWVLNVALNLPQAFEQLAYLGFNVEHQTQLKAVIVTQDRRIDIAEKSTNRNVFQCHVIGPKGSGKTVFCRSFLGESLNHILQLRSNQQPSYIINTTEVKGQTKFLIMHEVDVYSPDDQLTNYEKNADVICLLYDGMDPSSFAYCAKIYLRYFYRTKVPCLFVASKAGRYDDFEQSYEFQPSDFCLTHQLPKPLRFCEIGNSNSVIYSNLATMAAFPHLKRVFFLQDSAILAKLSFGAGVAALVGFLIYKNILSNLSSDVFLSKANHICQNVQFEEVAQQIQRQIKSLFMFFLKTAFLRRQRVFSPQRGVVVTAIVVVSFHPFFLTESDGAYRLQCIYLDSRQSLSAVLNVQGTQPTTTALSPLPTCKYEILEGGPEGRPIPLASVGAKVYHLWSCQAAEPSKYCSLIHSCIAEDGNGVNVQILDERGCTKDSVLLQNLEYLDDLRAGQYATVYKFADRESIFFKCEVMVTQKQEGQQCPRPVCANTAGSNMAHFEQAPPNISSTSVAFDRRVLALRKALRRRIRDALSLDVLTELDVSEIVPAENDSVDSLSCRYSLSALAFTIPLWFIPVIRFR